MRNADAPGPEVTGAGAVNLTVTVLARDAGSGVARVEWYLDSGDVSFHRISGTARDGLWRAVVPLARCANPAGHLSVEPWVMDAVRLQGAATVKTKITILNTDVTAPQADVVNEHVPTSGPVHIRFHEDVRGIDGQNAIIQPPAVAPTDQPVSGTWACTTADGVPVDCVNGPVREARFTPAAPFPVYHEEGTVYGPSGTCTSTPSTSSASPTWQGIRSKPANLGASTSTDDLVYQAERAGRRSVVVALVATTPAGRRLLRRRLRPPRCRRRTRRPSR